MRSTDFAVLLVKLEKGDVMTVMAELPMAADTGPMRSSEMKKRILVVDDEEGLRLLYKEELEDDGWEVSLASSGEESLKMLEKELSDLVLLDIKMPGMDGVEVLRRVKEKWKELPVILCTAYPHYKHDFGTWASDAYVIKSSDLTELKQVIRDILGKKQ